MSIADTNECHRMADAVHPKETHSVKAWFGDSFAELHPLLQQLHLLGGGTLRGEVKVKCGRGLSAPFARRIAEITNTRPPLVAGRYLVSRRWYALGPLFQPVAMDAVIVSTRW